MQSCLLHALNVDVAGHGVNLDATAAFPHVGSQGMLALLFNHDGNLRADLAGDGASREVKVRV